jgi:predicted AAA+ superfamily ATPase
MTSYLPRLLDSELDELLAGVSAVAIEGPKAVGKTRTALQRARTVHRLDDPGERSVLYADPRRLVTGEPPVLVDEWQRLPTSWDVVRRAVDEDPSPGRFLLTGSASPRATTHSGAGRIVTARMRPLTLVERGTADPTVSLGELLSGRRPEIGGDSAVSLQDYVEEICASGFPALRGLRGRALRAQLDGYLDRIVDHDIPELGRSVRNPVVLRRWLAAYAAATASTTAFERIRDAATSGEGTKPSRSSTLPYRDTLERLWILDPLPAWLPSHNRLSRLAARAKHHLADPALTARLLRVGPDTLLAGDPGPFVLPRDGTLLGALFESLVTLDLRVYAQVCEATVGHLRTRAGEHEVDLIVERDDGRVVAVEVKLVADPDPGDLRHLHWLRDELHDDLLDAVVVTTGRHAYRRPDGVAVVPAALLGP